jgi:hypothetical protein
MIEIVQLTRAHLYCLPLPVGVDIRAYFSPGSAALCVLEDGEPVFAGGIVNMEWSRGEAWMLPTPFFRAKPLTCLRHLRECLPVMASDYGFERVQATCVTGVPRKFFELLGFAYEGTLRKFGPKGETCDLHCRIFEVAP